jgi:hypothetical protein
MDRKVFFSDGGVIISDSRFIASGYIYNISDLSAVRLEVVEPQRWLALFSIVLGLVFLLIEDALFVVGGFFIALGIMIGVFAKTRYAVILKTNTGEHRVLLDRNRDYIAQVVYALDAAIINRTVPSKRVPEKDISQTTWADLPSIPPLAE